ncbi:pentapeptide repeat-containing protein [Burkholderia multivorans]|uniref:pentapeptide repeat-containing protein n=1 Tax=Burkholderia multivorans TaxID=87883 RepID=UPI001C25BE57|nr:pentapeptide repeat-containing protein [Burkholderia multivorans]MBU9566267.1 pentapeptide repeat-containing protein [Burkholderia multivorans]
MKIEIKHWITGAVLFAHSADVNGIEVALKAAIEAGANLRGANLYGANLGGANLGGANLGDANLYGANLGDANLRGADLYGADLYGANLGDANLGGANLGDANLGGANLGGANLRGANLRGADLYGANLRGANLRGANLGGANLGGANLGDANLYGANLGDVKNLVFQIIPEEGAFIGWKKLKGGVIAKLEIPADAKRNSTPVGRKNRAEFVRVLELFGAQEGISQHDGKTAYRVGEIVRPDSYNDDIRQECTNGIHFFITRAEAEAY